MMGRKQKLKIGIEYDIIYAKKMYCYLVNHSKIIKYIKRQMNKRMRREYKEELNKYYN